MAASSSCLIRVCRQVDATVHQKGISPLLDGHDFFGQRLRLGDKISPLIKAKNGLLLVVFPLHGTSERGKLS